METHALNIFNQHRVPPVKVETPIGSGGTIEKRPVGIPEEIWATTAARVHAQILLLLLRWHNGGRLHLGRAGGQGNAQ